jgi:hypothetical protein
MSRIFNIFFRSIFIWAPVIVFFLAVEYSSYFKSCIQSQHAITFLTHEEWFWAFIVKFKDELIVVFTAFLTLATIFLWVATRDLFRGAERTARQQSRAYVFVGEVVLINDDLQRGSLARLSLKNSGATPAYKVTILWSAKTFWGAELRKFPPPKPTERSSKTDLGPGASAQAEISLAETLNERGLNALRTGEVELYVFGLISYTDAFGHKQTTDFRFMMGGFHGWPSDNRFVVTQDGNEAT